MTLQQAADFLPAGHINATGAARWADLGCGSGLFTTALALQLQEGSTIHAVDKIKPGIHQPGNGVQIIPLQKDFIADDLKLPLLNGLLMANSLHFVPDKISFVQKIVPLLLPEASIIIIEYDTDRSNPWVPYPIKYNALLPLFRTAGYTTIQKVHEMPSAYNNGRLYSALLTT
ncbi:hypothetical protein ACTHGU_05475 [Chitinophagaceae bacterium MMS25-I14]